jgi:ParB family chromosome partitioning protein
MIKEVAIDSIKPDKNQPRKFIDSSAVYELSANIEKTGLIQPIQVDENNVIICGELRFRACKKLNFKKIPVQVIKGLTKEQRFLRQLSENLIRKNMLPSDEAEAFRYLINLHFKSEPGSPLDKGMKWLSRELGVSNTSIRDRLHLLDQPEKYQNKVDDGEIPATAVRAINVTPEKYKVKMRNKIMKGEAGTRDAAQLIARRLKTRPEKAKEILTQNYTGKNHYQVEQELESIAPDIEAGKMYGVEKYFEEVENLADRLSGKLNAFLSEKHLFDVQAKELLFKCQKARIELKSLESAIVSWIPYAEKYEAQMSKSSSKINRKDAITIDPDSGEIIN